MADWDCPPNLSDRHNTQLMKATALCQVLYTMASLHGDPVGYFTALGRREIANLIARINTSLRTPDNERCECQLYLKRVKAQLFESEGSKIIRANIPQRLAQEMKDRLWAIANTCQAPTVDESPTFPGLPSVWVNC